MLTTLRQVYSKHSPTFIVSLCPLVFASLLLILHPLIVEKQQQGSNNTSSITIHVNNNINNLNNSHRNSEQKCNFNKQIHLFQLIVVITMSVQLILRSIGISIVYKLSRQATTTLYTIFFFIFLAAHAALWIYSLVIYLNPQFYYGCSQLQPHYFFIKSYAFVYGIIITLGSLFIIVLALPALLLTIKSFKKRNQTNN